MPCTEDTALVLQDGTKKIVINAEAFRKAENPDLEDFLEYLKTGKAKSIFTQEIEAMIQTIKRDDFLTLLISESAKGNSDEFVKDLQKQLTTEKLKNLGLKTLEIAASNLNVPDIFIPLIKTALGFMH